MARPKRNTDRLAVRLAPEARGRLQALAGEVGLSESEIVRRLCDAEHKRVWSRQAPSIMPAEEWAAREVALAAERAAG